MYRYSNGQISLADFKQPVGMNLKESNRWVKKAQTIPWLEIEKRYAALFTNRKGNVAKPLRLALGACIIQAEYGYSDEDTALQIQENPYLQYFCGYPCYDDEKLPFDPSLMVYFRKRLTPEVLGEINEMIIQDAKEHQEKEAKSRDDDDDSGNHPGTGGNSGTMIVDATCAPSNIRYPQDVSLLNEARENAEKILDALHDPADGKKPRTYRKRARKDYLKYTRCRKHTAKMTRKAIGKQLTYLRRDLDAIDGKLPLGKTLTTRQMERLDTIRTIYENLKKVLIGGFLSLIGSIWALAVVFIAGNNLVSAWPTPPGRFLTTVAELNLTFVFILSIALVISGICIMAVEYFKKEQ